jgi:hypothetical protein
MRLLQVANQIQVRLNVPARALLIARAGDAALQDPQLLLNQRIRRLMRSGSISANKASSVGW